MLFKKTFWEAVYFFLKFERRLGGQNLFFSVFLNLIKEELV